MTSALLFFASLTFLRVLNADAVDLLRDADLRGLLELGIVGGIIRDLFVALLPRFTGRLFISLGKPAFGRACEAFLVLFIWLICAANAGNFLYFGGPLRLAVALSAHDVAWDIREVVAGFLKNPLFMASSLTVMASLASTLWNGRARLDWTRRPSFLSAILPGLVLFPFQQIPVWTRSEVRGSILSDQPALEWYREAFALGKSKWNPSETQSEAGGDDQWVERLADFKNGNWTDRGPLSPEPSTQELRRALGVDPTTPPQHTLHRLRKCACARIFGHPGNPRHRLSPADGTPPPQRGDFQQDPDFGHLDDSRPLSASLRAIRRI